MERISSIEIHYADGRRELVVGSALGSVTTTHTVYPPAHKGEKATAISFVTAIVPIPTPPHIARQMGIVPVNPDQD